MDLNEKKALYSKAYNRDPHRVQIMNELYQGTDMTAREYWDRIRIIAEGDE